MPHPKVNELSAREDFVIEQYASMKKVNKIADKLFDLYYIDTDRSKELTTMMRTMVPLYYVDPNDPEHPGAYILAGKSSIPYIEQMVFIEPYVNAKSKWEYDISAYKGLLVTPTEFNAKSKDFRKTKLEPMVLVGEQYGEKFNQSLVLRERDTPAKQELILPFLQLPNRKAAGADAYLDALNKLIYNTFYQYLPRYLKQDMQFRVVPKDTISTLIEEDVASFFTLDEDIVTVTRVLFPCMAVDHHVSIAKVPHPDLDTSKGRFHYIIKDEAMNEAGTIWMTIYTLVAALQMHYED